MVTPTGGTRTTPMTLEEAKILIHRQQVRLAKARSKRKARLAEARALVEAEEVKRAAKK